jgi:uncharacterized protein (TIGR02145 family)
MKRIGKVILSTICFVILMSAYGNLLPQSKDTDQHIRIGIQKWTTTNLNVSFFANGDSIAEAKTSEEWEQAGNEKKPAWCYYDNDPRNGEKYGKLYNWYALNDPRGLAPEGYHIATDKEWTTLIDYLGGEENAGAKIKSRSGWKGDGNGNNSSGFTALPGGSRYNYGQFRLIENIGFWWSSTELDPTVSWFRCLYYSTNDIIKHYAFKSFGLSVRCIHD